MHIKNVPLDVFNRALEIYGEPPEATGQAAMTALTSAESRKDIHADFPGISPFAQAVAEYMSLSGPWAEDGGTLSGAGGYEITVADDEPAA
jgi:hypothetical protein